MMNRQQGNSHYVSDVGIAGGACKDLVDPRHQRAGSAMAPVAIRSLWCSIVLLSEYVCLLSTGDFVVNSKR